MPVPPDTDSSDSQSTAMNTEKTLSLTLEAVLPAYVDHRNGENIRCFLRALLPEEAPINIASITGTDTPIEGIVYDAATATTVDTSNGDTTMIRGLSLGSDVWDDLVLSLDWDTLPVRATALTDVREGHIVGLQLTHDRSHDQRTYAYRVTSARFDDSGYKEVKLEPCYGGANPLRIDNRGGHGTDVYYDERAMDIPIYERTNELDSIAWDYSLFHVPDQQILDALDEAPPDLREALESGGSERGDV